ncbi:MAG: tRNA (adenosine(37)-N6)-dimethylallyltransferase MiaA [Patescibacteria group bacterium]|nr:tRNA (adenosine(37)-N6)-dimethylallyltransferase MiaA [Patescibacteria group bacterium]MDE1965629.1 tRNA (adenosine(37)-N6)-dimethylallyltransferase MiaA [Patescibacteria group bacterium]
MGAKTRILCIAGPTASGKTARAVSEALARDGEVISVDSRQVYRMLDIGAEKVTPDEMRGVPHHLIDIRDPEETYTAADFAKDAARLIEEISARGKLPILAGGTHFYFDALLRGLPESVPPDRALRARLAHVPDEALLARIRARDPRRAGELDPHNRRRLIRALEIIESQGAVPRRGAAAVPYDVEWLFIEPELSELRARIDEREALKFPRGLVAEVERVRARVKDARLDELGLEYRIVGEYLRGERTYESMLPALRAKLWQYARRQRAWLRKLRSEVIAEERPNQDRS